MGLKNASSGQKRRENQSQGEADACLKTGSESLHDRVRLLLLIIIIIVVVVVVVVILKVTWYSDGRSIHDSDR